MARNWPPPVARRRDDQIARLDPSAFEELIAGHYRGLGYNVERVGHGGRHFDGGIDLKLRRNTEYIVVQCKRENTRQVTHEVGHQLIGVMCTQGATGAVVVNTGEYTKHALESAAREARLTLVDGEEVRQWFPDLAQPPTEQIWEALSFGRDYSRRRPARKARKEGVEALMAVALFVSVMGWQCSRMDPVDRALADRVVAQPSGGSSPVASPGDRPLATVASDRPDPVTRVPEPEFEKLPPQELEEWKRKNEESMKILERTTPELPRDPRDG